MKRCAPFTITLHTANFNRQKLLYENIAIHGYEKIFYGYHYHACTTATSIT